MTGRVDGEKWRGLGGEEAGRHVEIVRVRRRKKKKGGMTNYSLSTYRMHPFSVY